MKEQWNREVRGDLRTSDLIVLQWNVLADQLAHGSFLHAQPEWLDWSWRRDRILSLLEEELPQPADVICLQEVDRFEELESTLTARGYRGIFSAKAPGRDGCCVFVLESRLRLVASEDLRYRREDGRPGTQIALAVELETRAGERRLRVATTHLKAKTGFEEIRRQQARQLVDWLQPRADRALVIAGDFNDVPDSPAHATVSSAMRSSYAARAGQEPAWTTWKVRAAGEVCRTIDYLWHTAALEPDAWLDIPARGDVPSERLPSKHYPSDHLSLACGYRWSL